MKALAAALAIACASCAYETPCLRVVISPVFTANQTMVGAAVSA